MLNAYFVEIMEEIIKQNNYLSNAHTAQWKTEYCPSLIFMQPIAENEVEYNWKCSFGYFPGVNFQYSNHGESLKSRIEYNSITVQQDATYSIYCISVGSFTCLGCTHPSSGARTTVITASGID